MAEHIVANTHDIPPGASRVFVVAGRSIGVANVDGSFYAIHNKCAHQGGPVGSGNLFPALCAEVTAEGKLHEYYDYQRTVIACPWHGWEFDVKTGVCLADPSRKVITYPAKVVDDHVIIVLPGEQ